MRVERSALLHHDDGAGDDAGGLALAVEMDDMHGLVEGPVLGQAQDGAAGHERRVQGDDGVGGRARLAQHFLQPGRGLAKCVGERDDLGARRRKARKVGQSGHKRALGDDQPIGGNGGEAIANAARDVGLAQGAGFGLSERIGFGQERAEVGIFPGLHAAMGQAQHAVGLDRLAAQLAPPICRRGAWSRPR